MAIKKLTTAELEAMLAPYKDANAKADAISRLKKDGLITAKTANSYRKRIAAQLTPKPASTKQDIPFSELGTQALAENTAEAKQKAALFDDLPGQAKQDALVDQARAQIATNKMAAQDLKDRLTVGVRDNSLGDLSTYDSAENLITRSKKTEKAQKAADKKSKPVIRHKGTVAADKTIAAAKAKIAQAIVARDGAVTNGGKHAAKKKIATLTKVLKRAEKRKARIEQELKQPSAKRVAGVEGTGRPAPKFTPPSYIEGLDEQSRVIQDKRDEQAKVKSSRVDDMALNTQGNTALSRQVNKAREFEDLDFSQYDSDIQEKVTADRGQLAAAKKDLADVPNTAEFDAKRKTIESFISSKEASLKAAYTKASSYENAGDDAVELAERAKKTFGAKIDAVDSLGGAANEAIKTVGEIGTSAKNALTGAAKSVYNSLRSGGLAADRALKEAEFIVDRYKHTSYEPGPNKFGVAIKGALDAASAGLEAGVLIANSPAAKLTAKLAADGVKVAGGAPKIAAEAANTASSLYDQVKGFLSDRIAGNPAPAANPIVDPQNPDGLPAANPAAKPIVDPQNPDGLPAAKSTVSPEQVEKARVEVEAANQANQGDPADTRQPSTYDRANQGTRDAMHTARDSIGRALDSVGKGLGRGIGTVVGGGAGVATALAAPVIKPALRYVGGPLAIGDIAGLATEGIDALEDYYNSDLNRYDVLKNAEYATADTVYNPQTYDNLYDAAKQGAHNYQAVATEEGVPWYENVVNTAGKLTEDFVVPSAKGFGNLAMKVREVGTDLLINEVGIPMDKFDYRANKLDWSDNQSWTSTVRDNEARGSRPLGYDAPYKSDRTKALESKTVAPGVEGDVTKDPIASINEDAAVERTARRNEAKQKRQAQQAQQAAQQAQQNKFNASKTNYDSHGINRPVYSSNTPGLASFGDTPMQVGRPDTGYQYTPEEESQEARVKRVYSDLAQAVEYKNTPDYLRGSGLSKGEMAKLTPKDKAQLSLDHNKVKALAIKDAADANKALEVAKFKAKEKSVLAYKNSLREAPNTPRSVASSLQLSRGDVGSSNERDMDINRAREFLANRMDQDEMNVYDRYASGLPSMSPGDWMKGTTAGNTEAMRQGTAYYDRGNSAMRLPSGISYTLNDKYDKATATQAFPHYNPRREEVDDDTFNKAATYRASWAGKNQ